MLLKPYSMTRTSSDDGENDGRGETGEKAVVMVDDLQAAFWVSGRVSDPGLEGVLGGVREEVKSKTKLMW